ncbi:hypothetical protein BDM02DRAFT_3121581 [Thelephora ganbajun]|uniref:Uncharacterized protein n=1 Tax=Thelephora ganbajun TaxID=370292 RepID=A0ACB6Z5G3_THEGA|nr:hypothetical protein BDM02DRAFT_3121581 [Thelephora ganbajun]
MVGWVKQGIVSSPVPLATSLNLSLAGRRRKFRLSMNHTPIKGTAPYSPARHAHTPVDKIRTDSTDICPTPTLLLARRQLLTGLSRLIWLVDHVPAISRITEFFRNEDTVYTVASNPHLRGSVGTKPSPLDNPSDQHKQAGQARGLSEDIAQIWDCDATVSCLRDSLTCAGPRSDGNY